MSTLSEHVPSYLTQWRRFKDRTATVSITAGGAGVLLAILLIFFYLLYEVLPLFGNANIEQRDRIDWSAPEATLYLAVEEQGEVAFLLGESGESRFQRVDNGELISSASHGSPTAVASAGPQSRLVAMGYQDGSVKLLKHEYRLSYPDGERVITPRLEYPFSEVALSLGATAVERVAISDGEEGLVLAGVMAGGEPSIVRFAKDEDFLSGELRLEEEKLTPPVLQGETAGLFIGNEQRWLYRLDSDGNYTVLDLNKTSGGALVVADEGRLFDSSASLSSSELLLGGLSLLAASDAGELSQFFMVRDEAQGYRLQRIRSFETDGVVIQQLLPEHRRKGFLALGQSGELQIYHTTAHRRLLSVGSEQGVDAARRGALTPRGNGLFVIGGEGQASAWDIDNKHPDISWSALWQEVWYESYDEPAYIWQSSASNNDFEPKYSFAPLAFGTLKAAFYTMLIAAPMAICGAIYTAYFMAPALRRKIKPLIELMEALPTVILGFLAGLWLAPFIEDKLTGVITLLLFMPFGVLLFAFIWSQLPLAIRSKVPEGWHAAVLVPVVIFIGWFSFASNDVMELWLFGGDMRVWITNELGISFDQRNSLVVGIAMGMAVIPTIFSIAEDAIFSVPKHLSYGSLALGATPWQTLVGVVLPTASPGIFSGLMIGLGRAVGETMIVLMATGNTPIMDANIFEGMRTLSANIAVEVPEAEVDSTHYRVLFLAAFVLFLFTFVVNTAAELVRQRLRIKYGSL